MLEMPMIRIMGLTPEALPIWKAVANKLRYPRRSPMAIRAHEDATPDPNTSSPHDEAPETPANV